MSAQGAECLQYNLIRALHVGCEMYSTVLYPGTVGFSTGT
jgi:hypothetical protein